MPPLVCVLSLSWGTCGFSAPRHAAGCPSGVPHLAVSGWLTYSCGDGFAWSWGCLSTDVLLPPCVFFLVPAQLPLPLLPLRGSAPLTGELACLTPVCWSTPGVRLEGSSCAIWFAPMCRTLPQDLQRALLSLLQVTLGFSGHRGSVLLLSW